MKTEPHEWFHVRQVIPDVWAINEPGHVTSWLVAGTGRAVLIDTGLGLVPIRPVVERLVDVPVIAVNTHHHFDHIGGNHEFDEIVVHHLTAPMLEAGVPARVTNAYLGVTRALLDAWPAFVAADAELLELARPELSPRPLPAGAERWEIPPVTATATLTAGDVIDLGGRRLEVVECPGHSFDSMALLDRDRGHLFLGDALVRGQHYQHFPDADLAVYPASLERLRATEPAVLFSGHWPHPIADVALLAEVQAVVEQAIAGELPTRRGFDVLGNPILLACGADHSITLPDPDEPPLPLTHTEAERATPATPS